MQIRCTFSIDAALFRRFRFVSFRIPEQQQKKRNANSLSEAERHKREKRNCSGDLFMQNKCFGLRHVVEVFAAVQLGRRGGRQIIADRKSIAVNAEILPVDGLEWLVVAAAGALQRKVESGLGENLGVAGANCGKMATPSVRNAFMQQQIASPQLGENERSLLRSTNRFDLRQFIDVNRAELTSAWNGLMRDPSRHVQAALQRDTQRIHSAA